MTKIHMYLFAAVVILALASGANAATISISGGTAGSIPGGVGINDFVGPGNLLAPLTAVSGYYGSSLFFSVIGTGSVTIDFFGAEAGYHDQFLYNSGSGFAMPAGFDHSGSPQLVIAPSLSSPLATFTTLLSGSSVLLPFEYMVNGVAGGLSGGPINGANPLNTPGSPPNFFASCDPLVDIGSSPTPTSCSAVWLFLDDTGKSHDDDFDDYVIRITVRDGTTTVPELNSFNLLSCGLLGLGMLTRKFKK